jgi:exonuclease III
MHPLQKEQLTWLTKIQQLIEKANDSNLILGGDLNDYFNPKLDKFNPKPNASDSDYIKAWKATCNEASLCNIWRILNPNLKRYTWRQGKSKATLRQSRLDYWLISTHMIYNLSTVDIKPGFRSDHSLINIKFQGNTTSERGPSYWRFNANLLKNCEYVDYMNNRIDEIIQKYNEEKDPGLKWS